MKIKTLKTAMVGMLAAVLMAGCSDDKFQNEEPVLPEGDGDGYYMSLDILMPNGSTNSRSATGSDGLPDESVKAEIGADFENSVTSALIVLANKDNMGFIAAGEVLNNRITSQTLNNNPSYKALARLQKTNLNRFYENLPANTQPEVYVFVFCNPTAELTEKFKGANTAYNSTDWINYTCSVIEGKAGVNNQNTGIWNPNSFLMNNVNLTTRMLPGNILDWEKFDKAENAFHLSEANGEGMPDNSASASRGPILVERSVARLDFKDGSGNNNTYNVLFHVHDGVSQDGTNGTANEPLVAVQLDRMALVNMSNNFYYIPRVSNDGLETGEGLTLCGAEIGWIRDAEGDYQNGNYVVTPWAAQFGGNALTTGFSTYFNYPFFNDNGNFLNATMSTNQWDVYKVSDVLNPSNRNDNYVNNDKGLNKSYKVWRYVTENAIPVGAAKQLNGVTTGIVFKARMLGTQFALNMTESTVESAWEQGIHTEIAKCLNGQPFKVLSLVNNKLAYVDHASLKGNSTDDPVLYYIDGGLYLTWTHLRQAAIEASVSKAVDGRLEINRSNSLYRAVFGDGPIPDGNIVIFSDGSTQAITDPLFATEAGKAAYALSTDAAWTAWYAAGKPVPAILGDEANAPETLKALRVAVTNAGITMFQSSPDNEFGIGYYCYYYYWNRHNDNNIAGVMTPMEFATVRNNVYKLSVDKISRIGHPRIPSNDPNPPTPDTPDESSEIYLDVSVEITPWAVRLNSIQF